MFNLIQYDPIKKIIKWDVPFYPQKDPNSCWYHSAEMLLSAYYRQKTKPKVEEFDKYYAQAHRLQDIDTQQFLDSNFLPIRTDS